MESAAGFQYCKAGFGFFLRGGFGGNAFEQFLRANADGRSVEKLDKEQMRASFEDMQRIMPDLGFEAKGYALSFEQLAKLKIPVIVYLKYRKDDHFSVLRGIDGNTVLLADPSLGHVSMSRAQFLDAWKTREGNLAGKILAVVPKKAETISNKLFFTHHPKRQTEFAVKQIRLRRVE